MLEKIRNIAQEKHQIDLNGNSWYQWMQTYFDYLKWEIPEVEEELKENNQVHLEDELWDILWTYMLLIEWLEKKWMVRWLEKIIARAEIKYEERINAVKNSDNEKRAWDTVKALQKQKLKEEHKEKYW